MGDLSKDKFEVDCCERQMMKYYGILLGISIEIPVTRFPKLLVCSRCPVAPYCFRTYLFGQIVSLLYWTPLVVFTENSDQLALDLTSFLLNNYFRKIQDRIAELVAYRLGTGEVLGSNPGKGDNFSVKISNWIVPI